MQLFTKVLLIQRLTSLPIETEGGWRYFPVPTALWHNTKFRHQLLCEMWRAEEMVFIQIPCSHRFTAGMTPHFTPRTCFCSTVANKTQTIRQVVILSLRLPQTYWLLSKPHFATLMPELLPHLFLVWFALSFKFLSFEGIAGGGWS